MSHRIDKVRSTLARAIREVIARGINDPRASGLISVTDVTVSPDLRNATVNISVYPEDRANLTMHALESAAKHIRREAGDLMALKQMPALTFRLDNSLKKQAEVFDALGKASESLRNSKTQGEQASDTDPADTDPADEETAP